MATIPDTMKTIARDVQNTFEELVKLLLRKTLRPTLNPLGQNTKIVYNTFKGRYERGFIGSSPDDNINKYTYTMTHESLGWTNEILASLKVMAKFIKNNVAQRFPAGHTNTHNNLKSRAKVSFSDKEGKHHMITGKTPILTQYKNLLTFISSRSMHSVITNKKASFSYTADIPYTHAFRQLENIGKDIIDQTDPSIMGGDSAKMSTSMLRIKLYILEQNLANLSVDHPNIYDAYVEMLRIINSIPHSKMGWVINLIASLSFQRWENLPDTQQKAYLNSLGENFICAFNSNELITILLQSNESQIVLTSSYLYPLLKMLFIVFGYSKLVPVISEKCNEQTQNLYKDRLRKHMEKYRGASFRRGDLHNADQHIGDLYNGVQYNSDQYNSDLYNSDHLGQPLNEIYTDEYESSSNNPNSNNPSSNNPNSNTLDSSNAKHILNKMSNIRNSEICRPEPEPVNQCIYDFIKLFGDLYPTIIGLMGGTEKFPPESIEIACDDIPPNYNNLTSLPEYLWRYNDFSYCRYLEYVSSRQITNAINSKINAKAKYLHSI